VKPKRRHLRDRSAGSAEKPRPPRKSTPGRSRDACLRVDLPPEAPASCVESGAEADNTLRMEPGQGTVACDIEAAQLGGKVTPRRHGKLPPSWREGWKGFFDDF
jgi:hypothetical protein